MLQWKRWLLCAILATLPPHSSPFRSPHSTDPIVPVYGSPPGSRSAASCFSPVARISDIQASHSFPRFLCSHLVNPLSLQLHARMHRARSFAPRKLPSNPFCSMAAAAFGQESEDAEGRSEGWVNRDGGGSEGLEEGLHGMHLRDGTRVHLRAVSEMDNTEALELLEEVVRNGTSLPYLTLAEASQHLQSHVCMLVQDADKHTLGCFWLGPPFAGRTSHLASLTLITSPLHRRRGVASLMAIAAMRLAPSLGFEGLLAPLVFVSDTASVALHRSLHFKLLSIVPRAAKLNDGRKVTDAMQFWYNLNRPTLPAPNLMWLREWHPARSSSNSRGAAPPHREEAGDSHREKAGDEEARGQEQPRGERNIGGDEEGEEERGGVSAEEWAEHRRWMQEAMSLADIAEGHGEVPIGAVVVRGAEIIGAGWNNAISGNDPCGHAEIAAIRAAANTVGNYRLTGCSLYVTLEPCIMCAGAAVHARVGAVVFGSSDTKAGAAGSVWDVFANPAANHEVEVIAGVRERECSARLSSFFSRRRRLGGRREKRDS